MAHATVRQSRKPAERVGSTGDGSKTNNTRLYFSEHAPAGLALALTGTVGFVFLVILRLLVTHKPALQIYEVYLKPDLAANNRRGRSVAPEKAHVAVSEPAHGRHQLA